MNRAQIKLAVLVRWRRWIVYWSVCLEWAKLRVASLRRTLPLMLDHTSHGLVYVVAAFDVLGQM